MKKIIISLFQVVVFFHTIAGAGNKEQFPFAWSVEKDGKTHYILGTAHAGVSLKKDIPCSDKIIEQIEASDFVFLEDEVALNQLNKEDRVALFTGSREEREEVMDTLSPEVQQRTKERKQAATQLIRDSFPVRFIYKGNKSFKDLSEKAKEFLISHGADTQGSYADYIYFISEIILYDVLFSFNDSMDLQVAEIARSNDIEIKALDDNSKIAQDLNSETEDSKKPVQPVSSMDIEWHIENYSQISEQSKTELLKQIQSYMSGDVDALKSIGVFSKEALLKNRNELWMKKFKEVHENPEYESIFLAGGISHFVGSFNLIDQLKEEGFSVSMITCSIDTVQNQ